MNREQAIPYISYAVDDTGSPRGLDEVPQNAVLVGWQCGFEPLFIAVWSDLGAVLWEDEAEELASDYLEDIGWFGGGGPVPADHIL